MSGLTTVELSRDDLVDVYRSRAKRLIGWIEHTVTHGTVFGLKEAEDELGRCREIAEKIDALDRDAGRAKG